ncbi:hypothetical protein [Pedobacter alluvionis]|uniref:Bacteriocin-like protein n=1 Tax=Pedobacter alluvionis TaxID=475253 RepID=A0A497Y4H6_9SPHI|nr:hypothetical protein [Pedobacter alluvionis]RLJ77007.1 bacteriocin-like protein [Pedobacter alluvionis]
MKKLELSNFGVQEMDTKEMDKISGGNVPIWLYFMAPGSAYLIEKFEKGCQCNAL